MLKRLHVLAFAACLLVPGARAQTPEVVLDLALQPGRDLQNESTGEALTTLRVVEDRGIVARSEGRLSAQPVTMHLHTRQVLRLLTGAPRADGTYPVAMQFVEKSVAAELADGSRRPLPQSGQFDGIKVLGVVQPGGALREGSLEMEGASAEQRAAMLPAMSAALQQMARMESVKLASDRSVPQSVQMQVPVPGVGALTLRLQVLHRLLGVEGGVARVQQSYAMDFDTPPGGVKLTAEGSGSGEIRYDTGLRLVAAQDMQLSMKMLLDTPEGVLEVQVRSRQSTTTVPR